MATYLADTNLLLRLADPASPQHFIATESLARLFRQGDEVFLTAQNFIEFWAVATRPLNANGFGWTSERTAREVFELQRRFPLLTDSPEIFVQWLELVKEFSITGKRVHDARLVAVLQAHNIENLLTFNTADFAAFSRLSCV
ncbi:MAG: type II toxin-antitoxin system VapC family toxin, partial [Verrucomicrobiota bacterium]